jgi:hypothetical protein
LGASSVLESLEQNMKETARTFKKAITEEFDADLKIIGFKRIRHRADKDGFSIIYRCEERYIAFSASLDQRDYPHVFSISLGEGSNDFPESDWNCILLELMIKDESSNDFERSKGLFSIDSAITQDEIVEKVKESHQLLERYGQSFLHNDLHQFKKLRAEQNNDREPYKIYTPQKDGKYQMEFDKQSSELRTKYSKPK